jgi:hypothetical protein
MRRNIMAAQPREPVTVGFDPELLAVVKRIASQEDRTLSQQVRHLVAKALEAQGATAGIERRVA